MQKLLSCILLFAIAFSSCKKENDRAYDRTPEERVQESLNKYNLQLSGAQHGWKAFVETKLGGTYLFYFKFNNSNRVSMYSTFDSTTAVDQMESSYRLKALQQATLLFDTYSYLHLLSDPDPDVAGGDVGTGYQADFEYYFNDSSTADTIKLIGRKNGTKAISVRATEQEATSINNKGLSNGYLLKNFNKYINYFKRILFNGIEYELNLNIDTRSITFSWLDNGELKTHTTAYYYFANGIEFFTPFTNGNSAISSFTHLDWNPNTAALSFNINNTPVTMSGTGQPLKVDFDAPRRWRQYAIDNGNDYWFSPLGWHESGVDDVPNLRTLIPNYNYLIYGPRGYGGWTAGDLAGVLFEQGSAASVASYSAPPTIANGIIKFTWLQSDIGFGSPLPDAAKELVTGTTKSIRTFMTDPDGFYLIQTGPLSYDMVEASEGKIWISWRF